METWEEWSAKSRKGEVCGILGCQNKPIVRCDHCGNYYCEEHKAVLDTPAHPRRIAKALICLPVSRRDTYVVPGSLPGKCSRCGEAIWIAPSSWLIRYDNPGIEILCIPCAVAQIATDDHPRIEGLTPAQADEIREYRRGRKK